MTRYYREEVAQALERRRVTTDMDEIRQELHVIVTGYTQEDVRLIAAYVLRRHRSGEQPP